MMLLYCLATTSTAPFLNISQVYRVNQSKSVWNQHRRAKQYYITGMQMQMQCKVYTHVVSTTAYTTYQYIQD